MRAPKIFFIKKLNLRARSAPVKIKHQRRPIGHRGRPVSRPSRLHSRSWKTSAGSPGCRSSIGRPRGTSSAAAGTVAPGLRPATTLPPSLQGLPPRSVPEVAPTPLQRHYINLSVIVLICGAIAITALELGVPLGSPLVKLCVVIAAPLLVLTTADAVLRIWRSAWAWMPIDRGKGLFRLAWVAVSLIGLAALVAASVLVILA